MNILFLTMVSSLQDIETSGIYSDLMRKFRDESHEVYVIYPRERRTGLPTELKVENHVHCLGVKTFNLTKTNVIEKGIGQLLLEPQFQSAFKKYFIKVKFDLILYSTPPITFNKVIKYAKVYSPKAKTYLLLKDIFPQNAVDLGMLSKTGIKGLLYQFFRRKEKALYRLSDYIGCMSPANVSYLLKHNPEINPDIVEIAPNSCDIPKRKELIDKKIIRKKYNLPIDRPIFIYGGNMGRPQGISFLVECMKAVKDRNDSHFVIIGDGTGYKELETFVQTYIPKSVSLFRKIPKSDYDQLAESCDIGLIFLDYRFTIPNYPSRLLPYLITKKPILAVTDPNCDTGLLAEKYGYGFYAPSNSVAEFVNSVDKILASDIQDMGECGFSFYLNNYTTDHTYQTIVKHFNK